MVRREQDSTDTSPEATKGGISYWRSQLVRTPTTWKRPTGGGGAPYLVDDVATGQGQGHGLPHESQGGVGGLLGGEEGLVEEQHPGMDLVLLLLLGTCYVVHPPDQPISRARPLIGTTQRRRREPWATNLAMTTGSAVSRASALSKAPSQPPKMSTPLDSKSGKHSAMYSWMTLNGRSSGISGGLPVYYELGTLHPTALVVPLDPDRLPGTVLQEFIQVDL